MHIHVVPINNPGELSFADVDRSPHRRSARRRGRAHPRPAARARPRRSRRDLVAAVPSGRQGARADCPRPRARRTCSATARANSGWTRVRITTSVAVRRPRAHPDLVADVHDHHVRRRPRRPTRPRRPRPRRTPPRPSPAAANTSATHAARTKRRIHCKRLGAIGSVTSIRRDAYIRADEVRDDQRTPRAATPTGARPATCPSPGRRTARPSWRRSRGGHPARDRRPAPPPPPCTEATTTRTTRTAGIVRRRVRPATPGGRPRDCARGETTATSTGSRTGFFDRADPAPDAELLRVRPASSPTSTTTRSPPSATLYAELGHHRHRARPHGLVGLALPRGAGAPHGARHERRELAANSQAEATVVHDLNADPRLPFADRRRSTPRSAACPSTTWSARSRCSPTSRGPCGRTRRSSSRSPTAASRRRRSAAGSRPPTSSTARSSRATSRSPAASASPTIERRTPAAHRGDPLFAVWAHRLADLERDRDVSRLIEHVEARARDRRVVAATGPGGLGAVHRLVGAVQQLLGRLRADARSRCRCSRSAGTA